METKLNSLNIIDDLVINPQFNKSKIKNFLMNYLKKPMQGRLANIYLQRLALFAKNHTDIMSFCAVLLNLPITAKMIAIIAVFAVLIIKLLAIAYP